MSLRPIDMQGSITRAQTFGKIQDQLHQRGQIAQDLLMAEQQKEDTRKRKQISEIEQSEKIRFANDEEKKNGGQFSKRKEKRQEENCNGKAEMNKYVKHPYKGNFVDFSG